MCIDTKAAEADATGCSADELKVLPHSLEPQKSKFFSVAMKWVDRDIHLRSLALCNLFVLEGYAFMLHFYSCELPA